MRLPWGSRPPWVRWVSFVYVVVFVEGFGVHVYQVARFGAHAYDFAPAPIAAFFFALLVLDPLTALLVVLGRPVAPLLAAAVMTADMAGNWWVNRAAVIADPAAYLTPFGLSAITVAGLFVLATFRSLAAQYRGAKATVPGSAVVSQA